MEEPNILPLSSPQDIAVQPALVIKGPPDAYKNETKPRGNVFIANYREFQSPSNIRLGSEKDVQYLEELFRQAGYRVDNVLNDASLNDTNQSLQTFRDNGMHKEVDSLIVIIMSHGRRNDEFLTSDERYMKCEDVYRIFGNTVCPVLAGKPKLFLFQMCRGEEEHRPLSDLCNDAQPIINITPETKCNLKISQVFLGFSSISGFVSYRETKRGTLFINNFCKLFMDHAKDMSFTKLMRELNRSPQLGVETNELGTTCDLYFNPFSDQTLKAVPAGSSTIQSKKRKYKKGDQMNVDSASKKLLPAQDDSYTYTPAECGKRHGTVLIVNNLPGCKGDMTKLKQVFSLFNYEVRGPITDLSREQLLQLAGQMKKDTIASSLIVIVYGDGFEDYLVSCDGEIISYREFLGTFNDSSCPNLARKPKLFIMNTCFYNGGTSLTSQSTGNVAESQSVTEQSDKWSKVGEVSNSKAQLRDMLMFSVEVDTRCERGSLLTEALTQILLSSDPTLEIMPLLRCVNHRLTELQSESDEEYQYFAEIRSFRFQKDFYIITKESQ